MIRLHRNRQHVVERVAPPGEHRHEHHGIDSIRAGGNRARQRREEDADRRDRGAVDEGRKPGTKASEPRAGTGQLPPWIITTVERRGDDDHQRRRADLASMIRIGVSGSTSRCSSACLRSRDQRRWSVSIDSSVMPLTIIIIGPMDHGIRAGSG